MLIYAKVYLLKVSVLKAFYKNKFELTKKIFFFFSLATKRIILLSQRILTTFENAKLNFNIFGFDKKKKGRSANNP